MKAVRFGVMIAAVCMCVSAAPSFGGFTKGVQQAKLVPGYSPGMQDVIHQGQSSLKQLEKDQGLVDKNLKTFDTLDFIVFSNQEWLRLHESHSKDVVVNWPDGHHTNGIQRHIEDLKALFVYAPDTRIEVHPIRFGSADVRSSSITPDKRIKVDQLQVDEGYTCVTGVMIGTFTKPMPTGDGKFVQPTNKSFSVPMCTVGHWKNGVMVEEWLYWDNATYMRQIGLGK